MRTRIIIETDRARTESEKQTEILLDIRDLLNKTEVKELKKKSWEKYL